MNNTYDKVKESNKIFKEAAQTTIDVANDITQTLRNKIFDYSNQIDKISDMLYDGLFLVDAKGFIFSSNDAASDIFGYNNKNDLLNLNMVSLLDLSKISYDPNNLMSKLQSLAAEKNPNPYELFKGIKKDTTRFYIDISISEMKKSDNSIYYLLLIRDTTDRITREKLLKNLFNITGIKSAIFDDSLNEVYTSIEFDRVFPDIDKISAILKDSKLSDISNEKEILIENYKCVIKLTKVTNKNYYILTIE